MSPLTRVFTTWAFFDFGPYKETLGKCLLDAGTLVGFDAGMDAIRACSSPAWASTSLEKQRRARWPVRGVDTEEQFECHVPTGYQGRVGNSGTVGFCRRFPGQYHDPDDAITSLTSARRIGSPT